MQLPEINPASAWAKLAEAVRDGLDASWVRITLAGSDDTLAPPPVVAGEPAGDGPFTIRVAAQNADGGSVTATPLVWAPVTAVAMGADGNPVLTLPGIGQVSTTAVRKIG